MNLRPNALRCYAIDTGTTCIRCRSQRTAHQRQRAFHIATPARRHARKRGRSFLAPAFARSAMPIRST